MPRESATQKAIVDYFRKRGWYAIVIHGDPMQERGIPDIVGCRDGRFVAVETKTPTGRLSRIQEYHLTRIRRSGGVAIVAHSLEEAKRLISLSFD